MPEQKKSWYVKYRKDIFLVLAAITTVLVGVMGWHWTETAEHAFWWKFWAAAAVVCDMLWLCLWAYFWQKDKRK